MHTILHRVFHNHACMIGFVTYPPFLYYIIIYIVYVKGGQVTKPIMHGCEIPCEVLCACQGFLINDWLNFLALPDVRAFSC